MSLRARHLRSSLLEDDAYLLREAPGMFDRGARSLPRVNERGGKGRQVVKYYLPALIIGWRSDGADCSKD
jgi:hypothetical protein